MTNQWQFGVYGHAEDADDEIARNCILAVQRDLQCSASAAIKYICTAYAQGIQPITYAQADNREVLDEMHKGFAMLARKLDNISVVQSSNVPQNTIDEDIRLQEVEEAREQIPEAVHLAMTYASKKPGMRLER
jgi:hypothetical protein